MSTVKLIKIMGDKLEQQQSTPEREELADIILDCGEYIPGSHADDYVNPYKAADAILAAGYVKHRKVYTTTELEDLPEYSVVVDEMGTVTHQIGRGMWTMGGDEYTADEMTADWLTLPATVIYEPSRA